MHNATRSMHCFSGSIDLGNDAPRVARLQSLPRAVGQLGWHLILPRRRPPVYYQQDDARLSSKTSLPIPYISSPRHLRLAFCGWRIVGARASRQESARYQVGPTDARIA